MSHLIEMTVNDFEERGIPVDMLHNAYKNGRRGFALDPVDKFNPKENIRIRHFTIPFLNFGHIGKEEGLRKNESYMVHVNDRTIAFVNTPVNASVDNVITAVVDEIKFNAVKQSAAVTKALDVVHKAYTDLNCEPRADGKVIRALPHLWLAVFTDPKVGIVGRCDKEEFLSEDVSRTLLGRLQETLPVSVCESVIELIITMENQYEMIHGIPPETYERRLVFDGGVRLTVLVGDIDGHYLELSINNIYLLDQHTLTAAPEFHSALNDFQ